MAIPTFELPRPVQSALVCGPDNLFTLFLERFLQAGGVKTVYRVSTGEEALACARRSRPDLVLTSEKLKGIDGIELARRLKLLYRCCTFVIYERLDEEAVPTNHIGVCGCVEKPFTPGELVTILQRALERCTVLTVKPIP